MDDHPMMDEEEVEAIYWRTLFAGYALVFVEVVLVAAFLVMR